MDEHAPKDVKDLLEELEDEYGAEEPLTSEAEHLLDELRPGSFFSNRKRAAEQLGRLGSSHPRILAALIELSESDKSYYVRKLAAEAVEAPVHQELLRRYPNLREVTERALRRTPRGERDHTPRAPEVQAPPQAGRLTWLEVWVRALTRPSVATFEGLRRDPEATTRRAYTWMAVIGLITFLLLWLLTVVLIRLFAGGAMAEIWGSVVAYGVCGAAVVPLALALALTINWGLTHLIALALGGTGTFSELAYAFATYHAPLWLITFVLAMIPHVGYLAYALGLYLIVLNVLALQAVHRFGVGRAVASVLGIPIIGAIIGALA